MSEAECNPQGGRLTMVTLSYTQRRERRSTWTHSSLGAPLTMNLEKLMERYFRLRQELSIAYASRPWHSARVDRLADQIARTEREIAALNADHGQRVHSFEHAV